jgi:hypothetical protein
MSRDKEREFVGDECWQSVGAHLHAIVVRRVFPGTWDLYVIHGGIFSSTDASDELLT